MFDAPGLYGAENYLVQIPDTVMNCLEEECTFYGSSCNEDVKRMCEELISENNLLTSDDDPYEAVRLYINLRTYIYNMLADN